METCQKTPRWSPSWCRGLLNCESFDLLIPISESDCQSPGSKSWYHTGWRTWWRTLAATSDFSSASPVSPSSTTSASLLQDCSMLPVIRSIGCEFWKLICETRFFAQCELTQITEINVNFVPFVGLRWLSVTSTNNPYYLQIKHMIRKWRWNNHICTVFPSQ